MGWFLNCALINNGTDIVNGCSTMMKKLSVIPEINIKLGIV